VRLFQKFVAFERTSLGASLPRAMASAVPRDTELGNVGRFAHFWSSKSEFKGSDLIVSDKEKT
jgi:hypothetical protein